MVKGQRSRDYPRWPGPPSPRPATGARSVAAERVQVGARTMREYGAIRCVSDRPVRSGSMLGQPSSACVTWSGNPRRSRASPSGPCGLSIRPSPSLVRKKSGKTSMPSAAGLREARTYSRPDSAARRRRWPSRPTRGTASGAWRTAGREAGARGAGGRGAGPSADISLLSRGRGKLGADPVRTLFEHVAGRRARTGRPGMSCCGLA